MKHLKQDINQIFAQAPRTLPGNTFASPQYNTHQIFSLKFQNRKKCKKPQNRISCR